MARRRLPRQREALDSTFPDEPSSDEPSSTSAASTSTIKWEEKERNPGTAITGRMTGKSWIAGRSLRSSLSFGEVR